MKLLFQQQTIQLDSQSTTEEVIENINNLLEKDYYFSHFIADGVEIYEGHEQFLNSHTGQIEKLEIITKTVKEFTNDILLSVESYTEQATLLLETLSNEFYNSPSGETWGQFAQLMESLQWINGVIELLRNQEEKVKNWSQYEEIAGTIQQELLNLEEAVENEDFVLIGDIIQYEIAPNFESLHEASKTTIDTEGTRPNLN
ncbi:hypothetical protein HMPREF9372_0974 [Sporosarcina newyorkensis 2681]|uniref:Uncharacterized protein n=1 Tax=Sporosarcina newyorkensis 2681 TaxID=1027292 RepID=F9DQ94_9BACL|nr:hypothetical protein [Sporosarcina newyorkensis]EGQ26944.1 hypothetical protein HMPREF9372_0974 [Sporosarcina newyorkensis 2681]